MPRIPPRRFSPSSSRTYPYPRVTSRKHVEAALRESEDRYRDLVEHSTDLICTHDLQGCLLTVNELPAKLLGYSCAELLGKPMRDFLPPDQLQGFADYLATIQQHGSAKGILSVFTKSGELRIWEFHNTLRTEGVAVPIVRGIAHDITDRMRAEEERKRAERELRRLSGQLLRLQDDERRRIARELHDSTGQNLTALGAILDQLRNSIPSSERKSRKLLSQCQSLVTGSMREIRTLSYLLHPPFLDESGIADAIRHYVDGFERRSGLLVHLAVAPSFGRLSRDVELALFRVVQESLTNIHRHSGGHTATIHLDRTVREVSLSVSDDGHGSSNGLIPCLGSALFGIEKGVGIPSMHERVQLIGGHFAILSDARGTTVRVTLPFCDPLHVQPPHSDC